MAGSKANARVVIAGAGPVGMVCALALNRRGVPVTVPRRTSNRRTARGPRRRPRRLMNIASRTSRP